MKVTLGIERWTINPETLEEYIIMRDYMTRLPKVTTRWDETSDIIDTQLTIQGETQKVTGFFELPYLILDFDPDENLEQT